MLPVVRVQRYHFYRRHQSPLLRSSLPSRLNTSRSGNVKESVSGRMEGTLKTTMPISRPEIDRHHVDYRSPTD